MNRLLAFAIAISLAGTFAFSQDEFVPDKGQTPSKEEPKKDDPEKELKDKIKKYEDLLKDAVKADGPYTLYRKTKDGKTDVYWELDPSQLGKYWFLEATLRTGANEGGLQAGEPVNPSFQATDAFRFERKGENLWLTVPNLGWRWDPKDPLAIAAARTFPEGVIDDYKIEAEHPTTKKTVIKVTELFYGGIFDLNQRISMVLRRPYQLDRNKSAVSEIKAFPENLVIRTDLYYNSPAGAGGGGGMADMLAMLFGGGRSHLADPKSLPLSVTFMLYPQKDKGYVARPSDPRVGYFTQDFFDHSKFMSLDRMTKYINRWHLVKKDPSAALSEPTKPIVWYVDDSVPEKWRQSVADGVLLWNKAFEKVGYKEAIVVKMKPKDADWDHADMRYNVVRFITSENAGYAVAWFRTDPFTGEIINAGISIDANVVMYAGMEFTEIVDRGTLTHAASLAKLTKQEPVAQEPRAIPQAWSKTACSLGPEKLASARRGLFALEMLHPGAKIAKDDYIKSFMRDLVSHEAGHCMGLRHNFIASTFLTDAQLANPNVTASTGTNSSVMDYTPVNISAVVKGSGDFWTRSVGAYDMFAIQYGYTDVKGTPAEQKPSLSKIAAKGSMPGHLYMTDENADAFDPYVVRFDNAKDPVANAAKEIQVAKRVLAKAQAEYPKPGRPFSDLTRIVMMSVMVSTRQCSNVARWVGGVTGRRNFAGDANQQPTLAPVDPAQQRAAVQLIARELFSESAFPLSERAMVNLSGDEDDPYDDMPVKDFIASVQRSILAQLWSADTTSRVVNNEFKARNKPNRFTLVELYMTVLGKVFSEVGTERPIGPLRRDLQRFAVEGLVTQALARSGSVQDDVRLVAWDNLKRLKSRLLKSASKDYMTSLHMKDLAARIDRAERSVVTNPR